MRVPIHQIYQNTVLNHHVSGFTSVKKWIKTMYLVLLKLSEQNFPSAKFYHEWLDAQLRTEELSQKLHTAIILITPFIIKSQQLKIRDAKLQ